ncbi:hypothetical protein GF371_00955 [Candidatus Woesearchaeota archaeon]|nr:hypothetical protein [Candidatus Woesearchaeota archaeon]
MESIFIGLAVIIVATTFFGYLMRLLKQPLIPAYVIAGLLLGPSGLILFAPKINIPIVTKIIGAITITNNDMVSTLSVMGIALMLFIVGLEIDFKKLKTVSLISSIGGSIQIIILFVAGYLIASLLGFVPLHATYLGLVLAFSSTVVVIKLLSDKRELDTLHGRIVLGILLVEDIFAIIAISIVSTTDSASAYVLLLSLVKALLVFGVAIFAGKFIFPHMFKFAAKSSELLFLLAVAICFLFAAVFNIIGLSIIIGAFIAGVALGNLEYNIEIISRIKPLKDFFATIFFASLGLQLSIVAIKHIWLPLIIFVLFITFVKPLITQVLCSLFGYKKKVGFLSGLALSQTSEFSLIIISTGLVLGHVTPSIFGLVILLAIITMVVTTYKVQYDHELYRKFAKKLSIFEKLMPVKHGLEYIREKKHDVVLCGYNRIGSLVFTTLKKLKKEILVVDYNPEVIKRLMGKKIHCIYGDVGDIEIIERMNLKNVKMLISTVPETATNLLLIKKSKEYNPSIIVLVRASQIDDALALYDQGADYVILPHIIGGEHVSVLLEKFGKVENVVKRKVQHIMELKKHRES